MATESLVTDRATSVHVATMLGVVVAGVGASGGMGGEMGGAVGVGAAGVEGVVDSLTFFLANVIWVVIIDSPILSMMDWFMHATILPCFN